MAPNQPARRPSPAFITPPFETDLRDAAARVAHIEIIEGVNRIEARLQLRARPNRQPDFHRRLSSWFSHELSREIVDLLTLEECNRLVASHRRDADVSRLESPDKESRRGTRPYIETNQQREGRPVE
jgi:hypothetical protein